MKPRAGASYEDVGVLTNDALGLDGLLGHVRRSEEHRRGKPGRQVLDIGYFANVVDLGRGLGLALTTDGVGTKVLIAQMLGRYDTIGIDCVAMNVNDLICVAAEPMSMLDYIGIEQATPEVIEAIGRGLLEGARQAGINIVGGEVSQMREMLRGHAPGSGLDLVGMCVGLVPLDRLNIGQEVEPGDVVVGLASSGIHSNGLTLARELLFARAGLRPEQRVDELGRSIGEELLEPTRIYVPEVLELLAASVPLHALCNITSDGLLNLTRIRPAVGFRLDRLPPPPPVFGLIQRLGQVGDDEMYRVFNMGIGFCLVVPPSDEVLGAVEAACRRHGGRSFVLGEVVDDPRRRVFLPGLKLVGEGEGFRAGLE